MKHYPTAFRQRIFTTTPMRGQSPLQSLIYIYICTAPLLLPTLFSHTRTHATPFLLTHKSFHLAHAHAPIPTPLQCTPLWSLSSLFSPLLSFALVFFELLLSPLMLLHLPPTHALQDTKQRKQTKMKRKNTPTLLYFNPHPPLFPPLHFINTLQEEILSPPPSTPHAHHFIPPLPPTHTHTSPSPPCTDLILPHSYPSTSSTTTHIHAHMCTPPILSTCTHTFNPSFQSPPSPTSTILPHLLFYIEMRVTAHNLASLLHPHISPPNNITTHNFFSI